MLWKYLLTKLVYAAVLNFITGHAFKTDVSTIRQSPDLVPCEEGWFHFGEKCYWLRGQGYGEKTDWSSAAHRCMAVGGYLVTIQSKEELDFIVSFLILNAKSNVWIGLQDRYKESQYSWHDRSKFNYTNWNSIHSEPSGRSKPLEDCVEMFFQPEERNYGTWNDVVCSNLNAYICQKKETKRKISPDPTHCPSDNGNGWKLQQSCYHIVKEKKSWHDAEEHCRKNYKGGHLVTVVDNVVDNFLNYILSDLEEKMWIGISMKEQFQQQWTSGWYVGYSPFSKDKIMSRKGYCIARNKLEDWTLVECSKKLFFICETSEMEPPVLVTPGPEFHCPEGITGLRDLGGEYCYFIETKNYLSWDEAKSECRRKGGNLTTIHSKKENDILAPFIKYNPQYGVFIGLSRSLTQGSTFVWSDGSAKAFENWSDGQPDNWSEQCVEIHTRAMTWNDISCYRKKGFICSVQKSTSHTSDVGTVDHYDTTHTTNVKISDHYGTSHKSNVGTVDHGTSNTLHVRTIDYYGRMSFLSLIGVIICIILLLILLGVVSYYISRGMWSGGKKPQLCNVFTLHPEITQKYGLQAEFIVKDSEKVYNPCDIEKNMDSEIRI